MDSPQDFVLGNFLDESRNGYGLISNDITDRRLISFEWFVGINSSVA